MQYKGGAHTTQFDAAAVASLQLSFAPRLASPLGLCLLPLLGLLLLRCLRLLSSRITRDLTRPCPTVHQVVPELVHVPVKPPGRILLIILIVVLVTESDDRVIGVPKRRKPDLIERLGLAHYLTVRVKQDQAAATKLGREPWVLRRERQERSDEWKIVSYCAAVASFQPSFAPPALHSSRPSLLP